MEDDDYDILPSSKQCQSVQQLWSTVGDNFLKLGEELLTELFKNFPEMKELFFRILSFPNQNMALQHHGAKLLRTLDVSIGRLDEPEMLSDDLKTLGARHPSYGVMPNRHKDPMKETLFALVQRHGKGNFDREAWDKTWTCITELMGLYDLYTVWYTD